MESNTVEIFEQYTSFTDAANAAILFIRTGKSMPTTNPHGQAPPNNPTFELHRCPSKANLPIGVNKMIVGLGRKKNPADDIVIDFIRLDYDPKKGLHFNVYALIAGGGDIDYTRKFAAGFPKVNATLNPEQEFMDLLEPMNRKSIGGEYALTPTRIWEQWKAGKKLVAP